MNAVGQSDIVLAMSSAAAFQLSRLRDIGWSLWDPIGLRDVKEFGHDDEYDHYLLQAVSRLKRGDPTLEVAHYLVGIASEHMALGFSPSALPSALATVEAIEAYLSSLQVELEREQGKTSLVESGVQFARELRVTGNPSKGQPVDKAFRDSLYKDES